MNTTDRARRSAHVGHAHGSHGHGNDELGVVSNRVSRGLRAVIVGALVVTVAIAVAVWPNSRTVGTDLGDRLVSGDVESLDVAPCTGTAVEDLIECRFLRVLLTSGNSAGQAITLELAVTDDDIRTPTSGDRILLSEYDDGGGGVAHSFADYQRGRPMFWLAMLFVIAVVALGRGRGLGALGGLVVSVAVLIVFVLPALLQGSNPVMVAIVGATVIATVALYLAHGVNDATHVALVSTLASLALTGALAWVFIRLTTLTGFADESALFLQSLGVSIDPRGLLLAGVVLGTLGVLDDITVTQVSAVGALRAAQPNIARAELYGRALGIGRDHISSTVNTLFLAYVGAALPLMLLFAQTGQSLSNVAMSEQVAVEIVRTLVGSIGLVAAVPISTALAVAVFVAPAALSPQAGDGDAASGAAS